MMNVERVKVGELYENCYVVSKNNKAIIIDPGDEFDKILSACGDMNVVEVLVTHHHFDHVGALKEIEDKYNIKENEKSGFFNYEVLKTPGHASDSLSFYFPDDAILFSGDFLFKGTIGRTDLDTSSSDDMKKSLDLISKYPDDVVVYPGHGYSTVLGEEKLRIPAYKSWL